MPVLLDTHALLWWLGDDVRLGPKARGLIADPSQRVLVSAASMWEIVVKVRIGKLSADVGQIWMAVDQQGFTWLHIGPDDLVTLQGLARHPDHRHPFDHLLIAQAITADATFVSQDRNAGRHPVRVATCSD